MQELDALFAGQGGVATTAQLRRLLSRRALESAEARGDIVKVWSGVYGRGEVDDLVRLRGLDLRAGMPVSLCLGSAARAYGFDTEDVVDLHVLNPDDGQLRSADGLVIHRRDGAPLAMVCCTPRRRSSEGGESSRCAISFRWPTPLPSRRWRARRGS